MISLLHLSYIKKTLTQQKNNTFSTLVMDIFKVLMKVITCKFILFLLRNVCFGFLLENNMHTHTSCYMYAIVKPVFIFRELNM